LCELLEEMVRDTDSSGQTIRLERLKRAVYRLRIGCGPGLVLKRHKPAIAQTDRMLAERWLPALGLGDRCPRLLGAAAEREGRSVHRLYALLEDFPRRMRIMDEVGGPTTLLHGDLWPKNVFVTIASDGPRTRLIDWDHVGVGSFSYDVSTFLYQSSPAERPGVLRRYREVVGRAGWRLPENRELNVL